MTMTERGTSMRVPPHDRNAEESVLGAILLDKGVVDVVFEKLTPDDFYVPAYQAVFEAIARLYDSNQPIDAVTVADVLRRNEELDKVGGVAALTNLLNAVPTAAHAEYYAAVVEEKALRRRLLRAGSHITELAMSLDTEIIEVLDSSESTVLQVAERRIGNQLTVLGTDFHEALEHIEAMEARESELTGVSTGLVDLDRKLSGLNKANLIIIAARPSMGKCLVAGTRVLDPKTGRRVPIERVVDDPGAAHVMALDTDLRLRPAGVLAAEPSGRKQTWTLTTRLGRRITASANHPFRTVGGWTKLSDLSIGDEIAVPRVLDVFGVERRDDAEVALVGYLIGDGSLTGPTPRITIGSDAVRADVARWADTLGLELTGASDGRSAPTYRLSTRAPIRQSDVGTEAGVSRGTVGLALGAGEQRLAGDTVARVRAAARRLGYRGRENRLQRLLVDSGLAGCDAFDKFVPEWVFELPEDQLALFLSRLYAADGSAWTSPAGYYRIEYSTVSRRLAEGVLHLLLRFGVVAKLRERSVAYAGGRRRAFDVSFQDPESVERFAERVGIFSKEGAVDAVVGMARSRAARRSAADLLPMAVWDVILAEKGRRSWADVSEATGRARSHNWHVRRRRPSRGIVAELADALDSEPLRDLASSDVVWDPIVSIEDAGEQETFDLQVPVFENFVADDVVVHNSALAANVATHVALKHGPTAIFSLEMSRQEIVSRLLCSVGGIDSMKLRTGKLGNQWPKAVDAAAKLYKAPIYVDDAAVVTVTDIRAKCRRLKRAHGLELVVVDYLQLMQGNNRENRQQEIAEISRALKNLARELDVPIIAVSQLNRGLEARQDKRPQLGDLRESGAIEQDADVVLFIYRDDYYNDQSEERGQADIIVAKHRAGATGTVKVGFAAEFTRFTNLAPGSQRTAPM